MAATTTLPVLFATGTHASRPAASAVGSGGLYSCTTHSLVYQTDGVSTWSTWASLAGTGLTDPMTTRGDVIVRNSSNATARLAVGAAGKILSSDGTDVSWGNGPMTTKGDLIGGGTSGAATRLAVGSDTQVLTADSTQTTGMKWAAAAGGGGVTQAYAGYNTAGGSWDTPGINNKLYAKSITIATACEITSIGCYVQTASSNTAGGPHVALYTDSSGPANLIAESRGQAIVLLTGTTPRWIDLPIGAWVAAGTYWIAVQTSDAGATLVLQLAYDGSGSDHTNAGVTGEFADWARYGSDVTSANKFSIRANTIR